MLEILQIGFWSLIIVHENVYFIVLSHCMIGIPGGLHPGQLEGVGQLVFGEVFRALHVLNPFNLTGKTST